MFKKKLKLIFKTILRFSKSFTILELLVVIAILGLLSSIFILSYPAIVEKAYLARTIQETDAIVRGIQLYTTEHYGEYPDDINRDIPPEVEEFIAAEDYWPRAPWPDSVYDWDNWTDPSTEEKIYQLSIRFCEYNNPDNCNFPDTAWAEDFDYYSAAYYCIEGPCRSHINKPLDHPGYCLNCE